LFLHYSNLNGEPGKFKTVAAGAIVSFVVGANNNGPQAEDIIILEEPKLED
jgi:cold shock CspA family protein